MGMSRYYRNIFGVPKDGTPPPPPEKVTVVPPPTSADLGEPLGFVIEDEITETVVAANVLKEPEPAEKEPKPAKAVAMKKIGPKKKK